MILGANEEHLENRSFLPVSTKVFYFRLEKRNTAYGTLCRGFGKMDYRPYPFILQAGNRTDKVLTAYG
jgi:hypothetical protein